MDSSAAAAAQVFVCGWWNYHFAIKTTEKFFNQDKNFLAFFSCRRIVKKQISS